MVTIFIVGWSVLWILLGVLVWTRYMDLTVKDLLFACVFAPLLGPMFLWLTWLYFAPDLSAGEIIIRKRNK